MDDIFFGLASVVYVSLWVHRSFVEFAKACVLSGVLANYLWIAIFLVLHHSPDDWQIAIWRQEAVIFTIPVAFAVGYPIAAFYNSGHETE